MNWSASDPAIVGSAAKCNGGRRVGELSIVGTAAAVANAVHHATGIRVCKTPIRIEDICRAPDPAHRA